LIVIVLPPREDFSPAGAGAISLIVRRHCEVTPGAVVLGSPRAVTFPGVEYVPVRGALAVMRVVARLRPAVIEVHQQPRLAMFLALWHRRVLLFVHNDPLIMRGLKSRFGRWLARRLLHRVVCVSGYLAGRFGAGAEVLWNPLTLAALPARAAVREKVILYAGRMTVDKAPDVFIAAWAKARVPGWEARMIGGDRFGPDSPETAYVAETRRLAAAAGVMFEGPKPHEDVLAAMARAAMVVVPSRWAEPFGLTALEAMASGAALITTGAGGLREVAGEAAAYAPVDDAAALAAAMTRLAGDEPARAALAAAGLERAKLFDTPVIGPRLAALRGKNGP
jgi:glycosyltransferase involved in cell wall biosynthesis